MILHFPPTMLLNLDQCEDIQHYTRNIDVAEASPAQRMGRHFTALLRKRGLDKERSTRGKWWTVCVYDALVQAGIPEKYLTLDERANPKRLDDIDILITLPNGESKVCLYLKTSLRERWKQIDRDASIAKSIWGKHATTIALIYSENAEQSYEDELQQEQLRIELHKKMVKRETWTEVTWFVSCALEDKLNRIVSGILDEINDDRL